MNKAWETLNDAMPDELFNQSKRADVRRIQAALDVLSELLCRKVKINEWYPQFDGVESVSLSDAPKVANALEKEILALQILGPGAKIGITLEDKLNLYDEAIEDIRLQYRKSLNHAVTWAAFKNMVSGKVKDLARQEEGIDDGEECL